jgi:Pyruvate/2-oxoglutarate dehydrogenase complex, dehydrogenase (E1) component, eukaryotic type, alpha subunit
LYRAEEEIESWKVKNNPITRLGLYLKKKGWRDFNPEKDAEFRKECRKEVMDALKKGTQAEVHAAEELFNDVYDKLTNNLIEQRNELMDHLTRYGDKYKLGGN